MGRGTGGVKTVGPAEADAAMALGLSLLLSIVLAAPVLWDVLEGRRDVEYGAVRYLLCFAGARLAVGFVSHLYRTYKAAGDDARPTGGDVPSDLTRSR